MLYQHKICNFACEIKSMERKQKIKTSTPLQKVDDALNVEDIIRSDSKLVQVHFISEQMVLHKTNEEIKQAYLEKFKEPISLTRVGKLRQLARAVYLAEISKNHDELVAEELMHAEWELRELADYWERSKSGKKKKTTHTAKSDGTELTTYDLNETTDNYEETYGDLDAMKRINDVRERIIKVLGLEAPKKPVEDNTKTNAITINIVDKPKTIAVQDVTMDEQ